MTIARRLIILAALPLVVLLGLGFLSWNQLARVETRTRYAAELQVQSLAALGNISRTLAEMRVNVRSYLLARDSGERVDAKAALDESKAALARLLQNYGDELISDARDQRMLSDFRALNDEWIDAAEKIISLATNGHREEAVALLHGSFAEVGARLNTASREWIQHNEQLAVDAGKTALSTIAESRRNLIIAGIMALTLSGWLGFVSFLRIVKPIQALESSVKSIAAGDYAKEVPFTAARDETGGLARSVDVLKQGAAAMDEQRWVKASAGQLTGALQGAASLAEFGQRFLGTRPRFAWKMKSTRPITAATKNMVSEPTAKDASVQLCCAFWPTPMARTMMEARATAPCTRPNPQRWRRVAQVERSDGDSPDGRDAEHGCR